MYMYMTDAPAACNISIPSPAVVFTARHGHHHPHQRQSLTCSELSGQTFPRTAACMLVHCMWSSKQAACHVPCRHSEQLHWLTGVLWYSTGQKWHLCYPKVHANRDRINHRHLCIKPRTFDQTKKYVRLN